MAWKQPCNLDDDLVGCVNFRDDPDLEPLMIDVVVAYPFTSPYQSISSQVDQAMTSRFGYGTTNCT